MNGMLLPIVTRDDEIIGYKERAELDYENDIFRTASLWVTNVNGDVLLAQRKLDKKVDPGKWAEAVGGTVEGEDSYEETVVREAEEELGLKNLTITKGPKQLITTPCTYFVQWYETTLDDTTELTIQEAEIEQVAWIPYEALRSETRHPSAKYIDAMASIVDLFPQK